MNKIKVKYQNVKYISADDFLINSNDGKKHDQLLEQDGFIILLDDKPALTPKRRLIYAPSQLMAEAIAQEWRMQKEHIIPQTMPINQILITTVDHVLDHGDLIINQMINDSHYDCLCYRVARPEDLAKQQEIEWNRWLEWLKEAYAIAFDIHANDLGLESEDSAKKTNIEKKLQQIFAKFSPHELIYLQQVSAMTTSITLALACIDGKLTAEKALQISQLEERFQQQRWGVDHEATLRHEKLNNDAKDLDQWLNLLN